LYKVFASIGTPAKRPFQPDPFQLDAVKAIRFSDCLVTAPTGAGKTWIAERAIDWIVSQGGRAWYASPLKALSNAKHGEFGALFGSDRVGILTGDRKENADAPIIVGTTEILRNQLYDAMHLGHDLNTDLVILDEAHFMADPDRGVVWEEVMIYLPSRVPLLLLSATIGNADQISEWLASIHRKRCVVVETTERPVPLYPLFFHPSGTLLPLMSPGKRIRLDAKVRAYLDKRNPPMLSQPGQLPPFGDMIRALSKHDLLPAIFFLKSRADCDRALRLCKGRTPRDPEQRSRLQSAVQHLTQNNPHLLHHRQLWYLTRLGVGAHHGGQLPGWKLVLETLMTDGLLDAIFATSTVAAGVNFPARSIVFFHSDRFDGHQFVPLTPTEFHQMSGRAGRRGMDKIGFAIVVPGPTMDIEHMARLLRSSPSGIQSQVRVTFSMVMNLLLSHAPADIEHLFALSFAAHLQQDRKQKQLLRDLARHLDFLKRHGYVNLDGTLSETGRWASQLRVDQPLLIAEALKRGVLPTRDPSLLAAVIASFVHEREADEHLSKGQLARQLERAHVRLQRSLQPFLLQLRKARFAARPLYLRPAAAMHAWASGEPWTTAVTISQMADGDLSMLVSRTADNLRHIQTLGSSFPNVSRAADQAIDLIMREPVTLQLP
jgi:superfamily II RNA helicase